MRITWLGHGTFQFELPSGQLILMDPWTAPDQRVLYVAGDTNVFTDMHIIEQLYHPELAFLPIGDLYTMSAREAALACKLIKARKIIPMHFGTFPPLTGRPEQLTELVGNFETS